MSETAEMVDETERGIEEARREVALAANKVATVGAHAARCALLREPAVALRWVVELRDVANALQGALEGLRDLEGSDGERMAGDPRLSSAARRALKVELGAA